MGKTSASFSLVFILLLDSLQWESSPKERVVILQAWRPGYSKLRLPSDAELAPSQGLFGDTGEGSLTYRTELISGLKPGDYPASQPQLQAGTTQDP